LKNEKDLKLQSTTHNNINIIKMKSAYVHLREAFKQKAPAEWQEHLIRWRKSNAIVRVQKPFRLDRARTLGYKAKNGFVVVRVKLFRGGRQKPKIRGGRRSKRTTLRKVLKMNYQAVAEQRASRKFPNLEVLNSYYLAQDGIYNWFEVILVDPSCPEIISDKNINWICSKKHSKRALRGLTASSRKSRGLA
jgi:large subunit ribosomal protein L15e